MRDLTVGVFEHLEITSPMDDDKRIKYTQNILSVTSLKKYKQILVGCKESEKGLSGDQWDMGVTKNVTV